MTRVGTTSDPSRLTAADLFAEVRGELAAVENRLQSELRSRHASVDQVVRHGYRLGGKRSPHCCYWLAKLVVS